MQKKINIFILFFLALAGCNKSESSEVKYIKYNGVDFPIDFYNECVERSKIENSLEELTYFDQCKVIFKNLGPDNSEILTIAMCDSSKVISYFEDIELTFITHDLNKIPIYDIKIFTPSMSTHTIYISIDGEKIISSYFTERNIMIYYFYSEYIFSKESIEPFVTFIQSTYNS